MSTICIPGTQVSILSFYPLLGCNGGGLLHHGVCVFLVNPTQPDRCGGAETAADVFRTPGTSQAFYVFDPGAGVLGLFHARVTSEPLKRTGFGASMSTPRRQHRNMIRDSPRQWRTNVVACRGRDLID